MPISNFGQNVEISPTSTYAPRTEQDVLRILDQHKGQPIRCIGRLHSWSRVIQTEGVLLDLRHLNTVQCDVMDGEPIVHVGSGCQVKHLLKELKQQRQWMLPTVGFITEQSIAGVISTGTHGSGRHSLSHYVIQVRVAQYDPVTGKAIVVTHSGGDLLKAARCALGCLGIILSVTLQCRPGFHVEESFREYEKLEQVLRCETEYPLQQFYLVPWKWTWIAQHRHETKSSSSWTLRLYLWYRFIVFDILMHLLILFSVRLLRMSAVVRAIFRWLIPAFVIRNWKVSGPADRQLVMEHELFRHIEIEFFVTRGQLSGAVEFVRQTLILAGEPKATPDSGFLSLAEQAVGTQKVLAIRGTYCHHYPICIRKILPDDTLISMASPAHPAASSDNNPTEIRSDDDSWYSITLTNYHRGDSRRPFLELSEFLANALSRHYGARLHWGKLCPLPPELLRAHYPSIGHFRQLCNSADPEGVFRNDWIKSVLG